MRWVVQAAAVVIVGGLIVSALRADARDRPAPPAAAAKAAVQTGARTASGGHSSDKSSKAKATKSATATKTGTTRATKPTSTRTTATKSKSTRTTSTRKHHRYNVRTGPNTSKRVAITFDDCPRSLRAFKKVVVGAEQLGIGLMLFPTGVCVRSGRISAGYARAHGHYVFNHSISHADLARSSYAQVYYQLGRPGIQSRYGRPPYGSWNSTVARAYAARGMKMWTWTVDTEDWRGRSQQAVVWTAVHSPRAGGTVLMHMQWHGFSVSAIKQIQAGLHTRGLGVCRNYPGTTPVRSWTVRC